MKAVSARDFGGKVNEFLCTNSNFHSRFHADKLREDSQYLNNQPDMADRSKSGTDFLNVKTGLKVNINSIRNKFDYLSRYDTIKTCR